MVPARTEVPHSGLCLYRFPPYDLIKRLPIRLQRCINAEAHYMDLYL